MAVIFGFDDQMEEWFPYPKSPDEEYCLRPLTEAIMQHWDTQAMHTVVKDYTEVHERDEQRYYELFCNHLFANWRGAIYLTVADARAQQTAECNLLNKVKFKSTQSRN